MHSTILRHLVLKRVHVGKTQNALSHHYVELFASEYKCPGAASAGDKPEGPLTSFAAKLAANVRLLQIDTLHYSQTA